MKKKIVFIVIIFLSSLIIFFLLKHIKNYFIREVFKKHIFLYFNKKYENILQHVEKNKNIYTEVVIYDFYVKLIDKISGYSYDMIIRHFIFDNFIYPYSILYEIDNHPAWMGLPLKKTLLLMHHIILLFIILCECYFNKWTLHIVFYYLPFYIIIQMYKKITYFLEKTNNELNRIIYERYYEEKNVLYVNTIEEEEQFILNYMKNNFKCLSYEVTEWEEKSMLLNYPTIFINARRFFNDKTHVNTFINYDTQEQFDIKDIIIKNDSIRNSMGFRYVIVPYEDEDNDE